MGTIEIKKVERKVIVGKKGEQRQQVQKTYGKIIYRGTLSLADMAEHIMKHGSVYTEDVVIGVITKLKTCMQEMLADGYKVKAQLEGRRQRQGFQRQRCRHPTGHLVPGRPEQEVSL